MADESKQPKQPARWYVTKVETTESGIVATMDQIDYVPDQYAPKVGDTLILEKDSG